MNQPELRANACNRRQARENPCEQGTMGIWFCFLIFIGWKKNSHNEVTQNEENSIDNRSIGIFAGFWICKNHVKWVVRFSQVKFVIFDESFTKPH